MPTVNISQTTTPLKLDEYGQPECPGCGQNYLHDLGPEVVEFLKPRGLMPVPKGEDQWGEAEVFRVVECETCSNITALHWRSYKGRTLMETTSVSVGEGK